MSEYAPPPPKVRVTKAQQKKMQKNYKKAAQIAGDHSEIEASEKEAEIEILEEKLGDVF